jgi:uncharacterized protein (TIGR00369 family)
MADSPFAFAHPADPAGWGPHTDPENYPPSSKLLGERIISVDRVKGVVEIEFDAGPHLLNPIGTVQGGYVAAMLDDAFSIALLCTTDTKTFAPTLEMKVSYFRGARPGKLKATGRIVHKGKSTAFVESELFDAEGQLLAKASATLAVRRGS